MTSSSLHASRTDAAHSRPKKSLGQHFLVNTGVIKKIIAAVKIEPGTTILEIGPGPGTLTEPLATHATRLVAIEADRQLAATLQTRCARMAHVTILPGDILQFAWDIHLLPPPVIVVGNIPYNITSPILFWLIAHRMHIDRAILTMQREVAERLTARPGTKAYGALTVGVQAVAAVTTLFDIRPGSFRPAPRVISSTIRLTFPSPPPVRIENAGHFRSVVRALFMKRRKMLRNIIPPAALLAAGIDPTRRPETLTVHECAALARSVPRGIETT
ncbi:MAG: ribosomal RNA small subunit methyltransferase A [Deltaproteobacteria bacterium]|nr:ribosomal RNA small subunit methyltransferase A [Deltaproteobacteria bacterium]